MGLLGHIRDRMTQRVQFVDRDDTAVAELPVDEINNSPDDIEIARDELVNLLRDRLRSSAEMRLGESELDGGESGVDVRFSSGAADRYHLVVGADGLIRR